MIGAFRRKEKRKNRQRLRKTISKTQGDEMSYLLNFDEYVKIISAFLERRCSASEFVDKYFSIWDRDRDEESALFKEAEKLEGVFPHTNHNEYHDVDEYGRFKLKDRQKYLRDCDKVWARTYLLEGFHNESDYQFLHVVHSLQNQIYTAGDCYWREDELGDGIAYNGVTVIDEETLYKEVEEKFAKMMEAARACGLA